MRRMKREKGDNLREREKERIGNELDKTPSASSWKAEALLFLHFIHRVSQCTPSFEGQYPLNGWTHASPLEDGVRSEWDRKLHELVCYSSNQINDIAGVCEGRGKTRW